jgi:hypothetical protein
VRENHDVGTGTWIEQVLFSSQVVGNVVDAESTVLVDLVVSNQYLRVVFVSELKFITGVFDPANSS